MNGYNEQEKKEIKQDLFEFASDLKELKQQVKEGVPGAVDRLREFKSIDWTEFY